MIYVLFQYGNEWSEQLEIQTQNHQFFLFFFCVMSGSRPVGLVRTPILHDF